MNEFHQLCHRGWRIFQIFVALFSLVCMVTSIHSYHSTSHVRRLTSSVECAASTYDAPPPLPGKKGACFTLRDEGKEGSWVENMPKVVALSPYWNYSWGTKRVEAQPDNIEFIPMICKCVIATLENGTTLGAVSQTSSI